MGGDGVQRLAPSWLTHLLKRFAGQEQCEPFAPPAPLRPLWVIGDLHGRADLLDRLLKEMFARTARNAVDIVFTGDYIDRGPDSARVLSRLRHFSDTSPSVTCLIGNHEQMMFDFLDDPAAHGRRWLRHGGYSTLESFGLSHKRTQASEACLQDLATDLRTAMGHDTLTWLRQRPLLWYSGNVAVAHAALDPQRDLYNQLPSTLLWGHPLFFNTARQDGLWVAHGHTIVDKPGPTGRGRIAVDTGAYETGRLTGVLILPEGGVTSLST